MNRTIKFRRLRLDGKGLCCTKSRISRIMNTQEIQEENKLIAEFMGHKFYPEATLNGIKGVLDHAEKS